jgi:hypothetical protein
LESRTLTRLLPHLPPPCHPEERSDERAGARVSGRGEAGAACHVMNASFLSSRRPPPVYQPPGNRSFNDTVTRVAP